MNQVPQAYYTPTICGAKGWVGRTGELSWEYTAFLKLNHHVKSTQSY